VPTIHNHTLRMPHIPYKPYFMLHEVYNIDSIYSAFYVGTLHSAHPSCDAAWEGVQQNMQIRTVLE
jgi:hypothetical protein